MSALRAGGSTRQWRRIRAAVLDRDRGRCMFPGWEPIDPGTWAALVDEPLAGVCGKPATCVDHVTGRVAGGGDTPLNLRAACTGHNGAKAAEDKKAGSGSRPAKRWEW